MLDPVAPEEVRVPGILLVNLHVTKNDFHVFVVRVDELFHEINGVRFEGIKKITLDFDMMDGLDQRTDLRDKFLHF